MGIPPIIDDRAESQFGFKVNIWMRGGVTRDGIDQKMLASAHYWEPEIVKVLKGRLPTSPAVVHALLGLWILAGPPELGPGSLLEEMKEELRSFGEQHVATGSIWQGASNEVDSTTECTSNKNFLP